MIYIRLVQINIIWRKIKVKMKCFNRIKTKNTSKGVQMGTCLIGNNTPLQYLYCFCGHHPTVHHIHNYSLSQWLFTGISKGITITCSCLSIYFLFSVISVPIHYLGHIRSTAISSTAPLTFVFYFYHNVVMVM